MPAAVTVVGLGPGDRALRTLQTEATLRRADRIVLRTRIHPGQEDLREDPRVSDCDDLYEAGGSFEDVYAAVAERVLATAEEMDGGELVFAVPGHPRFGERTVALLTEAAAERGLAVNVLPALSFLDVVAVAAGADPLAGQLQILDAAELQAAEAREPWAGGLVGLDPARPCLVTQVYGQPLATATKLQLARVYPEDHPVVVITAAGAAGEERVERRALYELDRRPVDHLTSVWVPPLEPLDAARSSFTVQRIVAALRAPGGCPWDRKQTHASLRQAVIEEAYEVVDAIDAGDPADLAEELGDLLLQVALHSQIAEEAGDFQLESVYEALNRKLVRRHPHVFGDAVAETAGEVVQTWEAVKAAERAAAGQSSEEPAHPLDRLPRAMPALQRARTLLGPRKGDRALDDDPAVLDAAGATILAAVEAALNVGVDPERALEQALRRRFAPPAPAEERNEA